MNCLAGGAANPKRKGIRTESNFTERLWLERAKEDNVGMENMHGNNMNIIQHIA